MDLSAEAHGYVIIEKGMRPSQQGTSEAARYGGAVCLLVAALAIRLLFPHVFGGTPFITFYVAILAAARYCGTGPAILALVGGGIAGATGGGTGIWLRLTAFLVVNSLLIWIVHVLRRSRAEALRNARLAEERLTGLQAEIVRRSEEERHSAQLRAIVESSEDAIISKALDGVIQSWNVGAEHVFGYTAKEAIGRPITILLTPDRLHEESDIMERIRHGGRVKNFETVRVRKDGKPIHVSITVSPVRDTAGSIIGASHIARDITERKEFEEQLRQTQKLESLGVLAGGLAHDFNNLLTGIMGNASLAMEEAGDRGRTQSRLDEILHASERAALLIRQILAYAGKGRFVVERLDLSAQVREIVPLLRTSIPKLVQLELHLADNLPPVEADPAQLQQLIMNLAINAAEAIDGHAGTVTVTTSSRSTDAERQVLLEVRDTGIGMSDEVKARIFDPFFTTKFTGRGLGLSAVMGIIRSHRGSISVATAPGCGTTFTVVLPGASGDRAAAGAAPEAELRGYGNILVVDDEELVRNMARFTLERYGYTVELASDGSEAVAKFAANPDDFAAVLLDLTMPVMHGEDALRAIRQVRATVPVVLSSGYTEADAMSRFADAAPAGFLQKPYTATALARRIKQALRMPRTEP
jgi:two-component system, chemotaxis family, CheB/CheR fusion protein